MCAIKCKINILKKRRACSNTNYRKMQKNLILQKFCLKEYRGGGRERERTFYSVKKILNRHSWIERHSRMKNFYSLWLSEFFYFDREHIAHLFTIIEFDDLHLNVDLRTWKA